MTDLRLLTEQAGQMTRTYIGKGAEDEVKVREERERLRKLEVARLLAETDKVRRQSQYGLDEEFEFKVLGTDTGPGTALSPQTK